MGSKISTIGELISISNGSIKTGPFGTKLKSSEYGKTGAPVISVGEIGDGRISLHPKTPRVSDEVIRRMPEYLLQEGDIVFARKGGVERSAIVQANESGYFLGSDGIRLRIKDSHDPRFIAYQLLTKQHKNWMLQNAGGTTMPSLNESIIRRIPILLAPLAEQKRIADILGNLDKKTDLNSRMIDTLEQMARTLFKSWFVDFDPVRAKAAGRHPAGMKNDTSKLFPDSFTETEIGMIPRGWALTQIGEIADIDKGLSYKGDGLTEEGGLPMVNLGCFTGRGSFNTERIKRYKGEYREKHLIKEGDLLIANTDMTQNRTIIGSPALIPKLEGEPKILFTHHTFAARFKPGHEKWREYVFFTLLKPEFREIAEGFSTGTTVLALPRDGLLRYRLCLPPDSLLEEFKAQISPILSLIEAKNRESRSLELIRDALIPRLLEGIT